MARIDPSKLNLEETVVEVSRVSKVVKGGRRFSIRALVVIGDHNGHVGFGFGKAGEYTEAIRKGVEDAKKNIKKQLEDRYQSGKNKWFFQALRVCCHFCLLKTSNCYLLSTFQF